MLNVICSRFFILLCPLLISSSLYAESERADFDLDNDGLIEINGIDDLYNIHFNLDGKSLHGKSDGCPKEGCRGFELTQDIDFDTNQDGVVNDKDKHWSNVYGWVPIGASRRGPFAAEFNGNGFMLKNLRITKNETDEYWGYVNFGFFAETKNAYIHNLAISGHVVTENHTTGLLVGDARNTKFEKIAAFGTVLSQDRDTGLIVGELDDDSSIINSLSSGYIKGGKRTGGLVGPVYGSQVENSLSLTHVENKKIATEAIGHKSRYGYIKSTYWIDPAVINDNYEIEKRFPKHRSDNFTADLKQNSVGLNLSQLRCPTAPDIPSKDLQNCTEDKPGMFDFFSNKLSDLLLSEEEQKEKEKNKKTTFVLYAGWSTEHWDFGDQSQLPGLKIGNRLYRDLDADGVEDSQDQWPAIFAAHQDTDKDGHPNFWHPRCDIQCQKDSGLQLDRYPNNTHIWQDDDDDGLPESCDAQCESATGLTADKYPNDQDNDGILDHIDTDINNDGQRDADANHNGLIDIESLEELFAIRFQMDGLGQKLTQGSKLDQSGCPRVWHQSQFVYRCNGYELLTDINFDTNGNGEFDLEDSHWNEGKGWEPISEGKKWKSGFSSILEGNHHSILNIYIKQKDAKNLGLFNRLLNAEVRNLTIKGTVFNKGEKIYTTGLLAGEIVKSHVNNIHIHGHISGEKSRSGVLAGYIQESEIHNIAAYGTVKSPDATSGMIAGRVEKSHMTNLLISGLVVGKDHYRHMLGENSGLLIGEFYESNISNVVSSAVGFSNEGEELDMVTNGFYDDDSQAINIYWLNKKPLKKALSKERKYNVIGLSLDQFKCASEFNYTDSLKTCLPSSEITIFKDFDTNHWKFEKDKTLPSLKVGNKFYHADLTDSDFDGYYSDLDKFPDNPLIALDKDEDGIPDEWNIMCDRECQIETGIAGIDQFPNHKEIWLDTDRDGLPDSCDASCEKSTGLKQDKYPKDYDNDGIEDLKDPDQNGNGIRDIDADHDGLIDIDSMELFDKIRYQEDGKGLRLDSDEELQMTGCPWVQFRNTMIQKCHGYELTKNITMDTNSNGKFDKKDTFWNEGRGWLPIRSFKSELNGNGFTIGNIYIKDRDESLGLFYKTSKAYIHNLKINGTVKAEEAYTVALLVAFAEGESKIDRIAATVDIDTSHRYSSDVAGGIIGNLDFGSTLSNSISHGIIRKASKSGGLVGNTNRGTITHSISALKSSTRPSLQAVVSELEGDASINEVYRLDKKGKTISYYMYPEIKDISRYGIYCWLENDEREVPRRSNQDCKEVRVGGINKVRGWNDNKWKFDSDNQNPRLKFDSQ